MSVTAHDLWAAAHKSHGYSDCEADHRGVMSRAYYSIYQDGVAFHTSLASPGALNAHSHGGKHEDLHEQLKNPTINKTSLAAITSKKLGILMAMLHTKRVKADYLRQATVTTSDAADCLEGAKTIVNLLFPPAAPLGPIVPAAEKAIPAVSGESAGIRPTLKRVK